MEPSTEGLVWWGEDWGRKQDMGPGILPPVSVDAALLKADSWQPMGFKVHKPQAGAGSSSYPQTGLHLLQS